MWCQYAVARTQKFASDTGNRTPRSPAWQAGILATILCRKDVIACASWRVAGTRLLQHTQHTHSKHYYILYTIHYIPYTIIPATYQKPANKIDLYYFTNTKTEQVPIIYIPISGIWQVIKYYIRNTTLYTTTNDMVPSENNLLITCVLKCIWNIIWSSIIIFLTLTHYILF